MPNPEMDLLSDRTSEGVLGLKAQKKWELQAISLNDAFSHTQAMRIGMGITAVATVLSAWLALGFVVAILVCPLLKDKTPDRL